MIVGERTHVRNIDGRTDPGRTGSGRIFLGERTDIRLQSA